ncbi:MAG: hypothetical protein HY257_06725, partial [Chloroflexi bacterium]|nr:hypothetical protein [Chloroflexota bacterium]
NLSLIGRADAQGFFIYGAVKTEELKTAAREAIARLQNGEANLAVHPRCGTNLVVAGILAGVAALIALGRKPSVRKIPDVLLATTLAAFVSQPIGLQLQARVTTSADARGAQMTGIRESRWGNIPVRHVDIAWHADEKANRLAKKINQEKLK